MRFHKFVGSAILTLALAAPAATVAAPRAQDEKPHDAAAQKRVYDSEHKDYHDWDDNEPSRLGTVPYGRQKEVSRILEVEQEGAVRLLELATRPSR